MSMIRNIFSRERTVIIFIILLTVAVNSLPFFNGYFSTPKGYKYLGTVHYPWDYYYYLSQFSMGAESPIMGTDLYTGEYQKYNLLEWPNMFLGFMFSVIGINAICAYQLSIAIFVSLFLYFSYKAIGEFYPDRKDSYKRILTLLLFIFSNSLTLLLDAAGKLTFFYNDFYFSSGPAFNRLGGVPHHLVGRTFNMLFIYLFLRWNRSIPQKKMQKIPVLFLCVISGFVSASIDPVHFAMVGGGIVTGYLIHYLSKKYILKKDGQAEILSSLIPVLLFILFGLPMVLYLKNLVLTLPYSLSAAWDASQQVRVSFWFFLRALGIVSFVSLIGLILVLRKMTLPKMIAGTFVVLPMMFFYSGIPALLHVSNARVISPMMIFAMAYLTVETVNLLAGKLKKYKTLFIAAVILIFSILLLPLFVYQLSLRIKTDITTGYIPVNDYATIMKLKQLTKPSETILANLPFNWFIPALSGRRVYAGHEVLTIDIGRKSGLLSDFFYSRMDKKRMSDFLKREGIDYIFSYASEQFYTDLPELEKIYTDGHISIYKIFGK